MATLKRIIKLVPHNAMARTNRSTLVLSEVIGENVVEVEIDLSDLDHLINFNEALDNLTKERRDCLLKLADKLSTFCGHKTR